MCIYASICTNICILVLYKTWMKNVKWYTIYIHAVSLSVPKSTRRFGYMSVLHFRAQLPESPSSLVLWPPALMLRWAHGCIILSVEDGKVKCPHGECSRWSSIISLPRFFQASCMKMWVDGYDGMPIFVAPNSHTMVIGTPKLPAPPAHPPTDRRTWLRNQ